MRAARPAAEALKQLLAKTAYVPPTATAPAPGVAGSAAGAAAPIAQYVPMLQPAVAAVPEEGVRVVGGAATCGIVAAAAEKNVKKKKVKRGHGKREKGKGTYTQRICPHCGRYMDKKVNHGEGKCEPKPAEQQ